MRRNYLAYITLAMFLLLVVGAWPAEATITGSVHDLRASSGGVAILGEDQICRACHVPHFATATNPLWNHDLTAVGVYQLYTGLDLEAAAAQPTGTALLCLSCHDGSVAIDSYGGSPTGGGTVPTPAAVDVGGAGNDDLSDDHPISLDYIAAQGTDGELNVATSPLGNATIVDFLEQGTLLQCMTCHDVHNSTAEVGTNPKLLREDTAGSLICLACHVK